MHTHFARQAARPLLRSSGQDNSSNAGGERGVYGLLTKFKENRHDRACFQDWSRCSRRTTEPRVLRATGDAMALSTRFKSEPTPYIRYHPVYRDCTCTCVLPLSLMRRLRVPSHFPHLHRQPDAAHHGHGQQQGRHGRGALPSLLPSLDLDLDLDLEFPRHEHLGGSAVGWRGEGKEVTREQHVDV